MQRFWFLVILPLWNGSAGCLEASMHLDDRDEGVRRIEETRVEIAETGAWPHIEWWTDEADPLGGWFDFTSIPWVSAARGSGDCDDAMALAEAILRGYETLRVFVESSRGWHAALLWHTPGGWVVISNMVLLPWIADTAEEVAYMIFGSDTQDVFIFY